MQIHIETTGCRLNQIESESAARIFFDNGFQVTLSALQAKSEIDEECLVAVLNTCAVTQKAEQKDRRIIKLLLEKCPNAAIVVTGCYAQLSSEKIQEMDKRIASLPGLLKSRIGEVAVLLKDYKDNFNAEKFSEYLRNEVFSKPIEKKDFSENAFKLSTDSFQAHSRSSIKIQDGCNCCCSYCTIHIARGKSVSLDAQTVIDRVVQLEKAGQSEVVITTVNIGQYKGEYKGGYINFSQLLYLLLKNTSKINFRISSLYPEIVDDYFCEVIKKERVRPHFHISVQSGSDSVLRKMARAYKASDVIEAVKKIRAVKKNPFIACDIITGFPGESDEDFEQTMELCRECDFSWVHVFPFSERPGTPACNMKPKVPQSLRDERAAKLGKWASENKHKYIESCIGNTYDAVLETVKRPAVYASGNVKIYHAVTENFLHCEITASSAESFAQGQSVKVKILSQKSDLSKGGETECTAQIVSF